MIPWKLREGSLRALQGWAAEVSELIKIHEWENNQQLVIPFMCNPIIIWEEPQSEEPLMGKSIIFPFCL